MLIVYAIETFFKRSHTHVHIFIYLVDILKNRLKRSSIRFSCTYCIAKRNTVQTNKQTLFTTRNEAKFSENNFPIMHIKKYLSNVLSF